jgi:hypothetical protein
MANDSIFEGKKYDRADLEAAIRSHPAGNRKSLLDKDAKLDPAATPALTPLPKQGPPKTAQHLKRVR